MTTKFLTITPCSFAFLVAIAATALPVAEDASPSNVPATSTNISPTDLTGKPRPVSEPANADEQENRQREFPLNQIPPGARARALSQIENAEMNSAPRSEFGIIKMWSSIGPAAIANSPYANNGQASGRVAALAIDPSNPAHWLIGAAQGGIWETSNNGSTWEPRTDDQPSLAMGAIAFAPSDPSTVYAGTGEPNFRGDDYAGEGLLVSHNGGTHWSMLNTTFAQTSFSAIRVNATDPLHLSVATVRGGGGVADAATGSNVPPSAPPRGVFVSSDGGAHFAQVLTGEATDLQAHPGNFNFQYAALGEIYGAPANGVYRTLDGWATTPQLINGPWTALASPAQMGRIVMALSPSDPNSLYVAVAQKRTDYLAGLVGIWRTTNAWDPTPTWTALPNPPVFTDDISSPRFWYHFSILVDPKNADTLYLTEYDVWRFTPSSWTRLTGAIHVDNHVMAWVPTANNTMSLLVGNDGGVWLSDPLVSGSWNDLNNGLAISQIYRGSVDPTGQSHLALAGTQDNGTAVYTGNRVWQFVFGGDGADCAVSAANPNTTWAFCYETIGVVDIYRTLNAAGFSSSAGGGIDTGVLPFTTQFFVHFEKSPHNDDLFLAGTAQLWRCNDFFSGTPPHWSINSPVMSNANGPVPISAIAFAPSDSAGLVYAFGTEDGQLRITTDGGSSWQNLDPANALPGRYISGLAFSPNDPNVLFVTLSGFDEGTPGKPGHLFTTSNALAATPTWINISPPVDLPNDCLAIDPNNSNTIYVGSDIGVWVTSDGGVSWGHYGPTSGMPNVAVFDLRMNPSGQLTAFTHGRSAFLLNVYVNWPIIEYAPDACFVCPKPPCLTCPFENWVNTGDPAEFELPLRNILPINTVNLTASIVPSARVTPLKGAQTYGKLLGQGPPVSRTFTFTINRRAAAAGAEDPLAFRSQSVSCGETVPVVFQLRDESNDLGRITVPFRVGVPSHPLVQDFERVRESALPPGWTSSAKNHDGGWIATTKLPPNAVLASVGEDVVNPIRPRNVNVFTPARTIGQSYLTSAIFTAATAHAELYFQQAFNLARAADGGILEIAIGKHPFEEIVHAGGSFTRTGYSTKLTSRNPIGSRLAWSGNSGGWLPVSVNLPARAEGQPIRLRWHLATSRGLTNGFWSIDTVLVTEPLCPPPGTKRSPPGAY